MKNNCNNRITALTVCKTTLVPPQSAVKVQCEMDAEFPQYIVEPLSDNKVIIPRSVHQGGSTPVIFVVNLTERQVKLKQGTHLANACPASVVPPVPGELYIPRINQMGCKKEKDEAVLGIKDVPPHIKRTL